jgi:hypothetical protein
MDMPWKMLTSPDRSREYLALLTFLPLERYVQIPRFLSFTFRIQSQLARTPGVIGYALRAKPWVKNFWTLSVWESDQALMDFVRNDPHALAMASIVMGPTSFTRWKIAGADVPPGWDDAMRRSKEKANG